MSTVSERYKKRIIDLRLTKTSYMSNAKWRKLFNAIEENGQCTFPARIKTIGDEGVYHFSTNPGIYETMNYTMDGWCGPPVAFRDIEWIYVPTVSEIERYNRDEKLESKFIQRDIAKLKKLIDEIGKFEYDFDENGLKLYGYR